MAYDLAELHSEYKGLQKLWQIFPEARLVGGAVRDYLLGLKPQDIDMAVPLPPEMVMARLKMADQSFIPTGIAHGTVSVPINHKMYELTSLRQDVETDGRHAQVAWTVDWKRDAARRDFTINAMSIDQYGNLYDYFGGKEDLKTGRVCFVGDPEKRIQEDYLRILRYFRFSARFDQNLPSSFLIKIISENISGFLTLAKERIRAEFSHILLGPKLFSILKIMEVSGILPAMLPKYDLSAFDDRLGINFPRNFILRLFLLCPDRQMLQQAFPLSKKEKQKLSFYLSFSKIFHLSPDAPTLLQWLDHYDREALIEYSWIAQRQQAKDMFLYQKICQDNLWERLRARLEKTELPDFPVQGRDLLERNIPAGVEMGELLLKMRLYWLKEEAKPDKKAILTHFGLEF